MSVLKTNVFKPGDIMDQNGDSFSFLFFNGWRQCPPHRVDACLAVIVTIRAKADLRMKAIALALALALLLYGFHMRRYYCCSNPSPPSLQYRAQSKFRSVDSSPRPSSIPWYHVKMQQRKLYPYRSFQCGVIHHEESADPFWPLMFDLQERTLM